MSLVDLILLGIALGIDCFVVSFSQGIIFTFKRRINSAKLALTMGLFQGIMPIAGYIATDKAYNFLAGYSKFIVFGIFFILGVHFISEAFTKNNESKSQCIDLKCLIGLGIATSIDALISGSSLRLTSTNLLLSCFIIGLLSFVMSLVGFWTGNFVKQIPKRYMQIIGGLILIILAIKSL